MDIIRCDRCDREFKTQESLSMHNSAKHGTSSRTGISGVGWNKVVSIAGILLAVIVGYIILSGSNSGSGSFAQGVADDSPQKVTPQKVTIGFNGDYYPNAIQVKSGRPVEISLDSSVRGCYRSFVIDAFGVSKRSSGPSDTIRFTPDRKGSFEYRCGMGMGRGTIIVE